MSSQTPGVEKDAGRPDYRDQTDTIYWEGERSGWGTIIPGHNLDPDALREAVTHEQGGGFSTLHVEEAFLSYMPRVKRCSRYDGWGCDNEGEWHAHWFAVKPHPAAAFTVAIPETGPRPIPPGNGGAS